MAVNADLLPAMRAIREALDNQGGNTRTIDRDRFSIGVWDALGISEKSKRASVSPRFEVSARIMGNHPETPTGPCNIRMFVVEFTVLLVRHMSLEHAVDDEARERLRSLAANDAMLIAIVLDMAGNLSTDSEGNSTGLISGALEYQDSADVAFNLSTSDTSTIETSHTFTGTYLATIT